MKVFTASVCVKKRTKFCTVKSPLMSVNAYTPIMISGSTTSSTRNSTYGHAHERRVCNICLQCIF